MAQNQKSYDNEFKAQAVKLAQEIGNPFYKMDFQILLLLMEVLLSILD